MIYSVVHKGFSLTKHRHLYRELKNAEGADVQKIARLVLKRYADLIDSIEGRYEDYTTYEEARENACDEILLTAYPDYINLDWDEIIEIEED